MSVLHIAELMDLLQFAWLPYALQPLGLDQQLRMYYNQNKKTLMSSAENLQENTLGENFYITYLLLTNLLNK